MKKIIERFSVLPKSDSDRYAIEVVPTKYGHQLSKYIPDSANQPYISQDSKGNLLIVLGFIHWSADENGGNHHSLLQLVVEKGARALERQEGQFVALFAEGPSGTVHIVNDRFASRPFYFLPTNKGTFYSSNLAFTFKLADLVPTPDPLGWLQIFRFGHTLGRTTNCVGAQRLRPGTHLTIAPDCITERQYWKLQHDPEEGLDPDSFADEVFQAFEASAKWRARRSPRSIIALSGGLDSRLVAACIPKDVDTTAFTFVNSVASTNTPEVSAASEVARRLRLPHEVKRIPPGAYSTNADAVVRLTDGLIALHHPSKTMQYVERLQDGCMYLLGGGPGDVLAGSYVPDVGYLNPSRTQELVEEFAVNRGLGSAHLSNIFSDTLLKEWLPKLDDSVLESFSGLTGPTAAHRVTAWAMTVRQPAFTFSTPFHNHPKFEEGTAHVGYRYSDLMLRLPADWLFQKNFYSYMIYRCLPHLRDVIYANTGKLLSGELHTFDYRSPKQVSVIAKMKSQAKKLPLVQKLRDVLPRELKLRPAYNFDHYMLKSDDVLLNSTEDMLDLPAVSALVDRERCRRFIQSFRRGRIETGTDGDANLLASLATLCCTVKNHQQDLI